MFVLNFTQSKTCDKSFPFSRNVYLKRGATIFLLFILTTPPPTSTRLRQKQRPPNLMGHGQGEHCMTPSTPTPPPPLLPLLFFTELAGPSLKARLQSILRMCGLCLHFCFGLDPLQLYNMKYAAMH